MRGFIRILMAMAMAVVCHGGAWAKYPDRPIQIYIPAGPGGSNTMVARILANEVQKELGQPLVIVNRGGAGGQIATNEVAKAAPDGYNLLLTYGGPIASGLALFKSVPYDVSRDLTPIALLAEVSILMVASPSFPAKSVQEVIEYARANPGQLTASINSYGAMGHLLTEQFRATNKLQINQIPYKGSGEAMTDFLAGRIDIAFDTIPALMPFIKDSKVTAFAVGSEARSPFLPDLPTFKELGFQGMEATVWYALMAPANTPKDIIARLSKAFEKALQTQQVKDGMAKLGIVPRYEPPAAAEKFIQEETKKWGQVVKDAGLRQMD